MPSGCRRSTRDFGYDVADHTDVDPLFGDLADFDVLVTAAHARDLKVLVDFVPNHTSTDHPWFRTARASREDPKRDFHVWADALAWRAGSARPPRPWR